MREPSINVPVFPLGICLLPGEDHPLRIFEPRYKQLLNDIIKTGDNFAVPFYDGTSMDNYGCIVSLSEVISRKQDGEAIIRLVSHGVMKMISMQDSNQERLYAAGEIIPLEVNQPVLDNSLRKLLSLFQDQLPMRELLPPDEDDLLLYDIARALNFSSIEKLFFINVSHR